MKPILIYFLIGAIVAVWTAINQMYMETEEGEESPGTILPAYILIALAWPVSVIVSIYSLVQNLLADETH